MDHPTGGQIWRVFGGERIVSEIDNSNESEPMVCFAGHDAMSVNSLLHLGSCAGFDLRGGRVMVGDRWQDVADNGTPLPVVVTAIDGHYIEVAYLPNKHTGLVDAFEWHGSLFRWRRTLSRGDRVAWAALAALGWMSQCVRATAYGAPWPWEPER